MKNFGRVIPLILVTFMLVATMPPTAATKAPVSFLYLGPSTRPAQLNATFLIYQAKVSNMNPFNAWDILVQADPAVLFPVSLSIAGNLFAANFSSGVTEFTNCLNGIGLECSINDAPGIAHSVAVVTAGAPPSLPVSGLLFTITYQVVGGPDSSLIIPPGFDIIASAGNSVPHLILDAVYGTAPDFSIIASQPLIKTIQGSSTTSTLTLSSLNGFAGTVVLTSLNLGFFSTLNSLQSPTIVDLKSGRTASSTITVYSTACDSAGLYFVIVTGTSGSRTHSLEFTVEVDPSPTPVMDFCFIIGIRDGLTIHQGLSNSSVIFIFSANGFSGRIMFSASIYPTIKNGPTVEMDPAAIVMVPGGFEISTLTVSTSANTPIGNYTVIIEGKSGSITRFNTEPILITT